MPGPGQYEIKSQFVKKSNDDDDQDVDHPKVPFGSRLQVKMGQEIVMRVCAYLM